MNDASEMHARTAPDDASTEEVVSALDANRAALDETLSEIERRLSPEGLVNAAMDFLRGGAGGEYLRGLRDSIVHNPIPVTLTALGLAWTMFAERSGGHASSATGPGIGERAPSGGQRAKDAAEAMGRRASEGADSARAGLHGARERLSRGVEGVAQARERVADMGSAAAARYRESSEQARAFAREHPMVLAGAGLALGAALAAILPPTRTEDERLGAARDRAVDRAREAASEQAEHLRKRAGDVTEAARQEAERQGLTGERAGEALEEAQQRARKVAEAARREASGEASSTPPPGHSQG